jgi:hypothetical protein
VKSLINQEVSDMSWVISSAIENIPFVADGVGYLTGPTITSWQRKENAFKTHQYVEKSFFKAIQVYAVFNRISDVLILAKSTFRVPPTVQWVCLGTPIVLALVRKHIDPLTIKLGKDHPSVVSFVRRNFCLIEDHIGTASQVAALTSYIVIGFFGQPLLGVFGVICVTVGLCERFGFEACKEHNPLPRLLLAASGVFTFMQVNVTAIGKGLSLTSIFIASKGKESLAVEDQKRKPRKELLKTPNDLDILLGLDTTFKNLQISSNHLDLLETIPNRTEKCDFEILKSSFATSFDGKIDQAVMELVECEPSFIYSPDRENGVKFFFESKKAAFDAFFDKVKDSTNETLKSMGNEVGLHFEGLTIEEQKLFIVKLALEMERTSGESAIYKAYHAVTEKDSTLTEEQKIYRKLGELRENLFWESGMSEDAGRAFGVPSLMLSEQMPYLINETEFDKAVKSFTQSISALYHQAVFGELKAFDKEIKEWFQKNIMDKVSDCKKLEKYTNLKPEEKDAFDLFIEIMKLVMKDDESKLTPIEKMVKEQFLANKECLPWHRAYLIKLGIMDKKTPFIQQVLKEEEKKTEEKPNEETKKEETETKN